ncbi:hypothetical protein NXV81_18760 [Bacteroides ovatus]|nr:hypothetical protein [Bacteroides ovatus]
MFRKKQSEFQYAPGIEKIIEDIQGGGTIARAELKGIIDELPPLVIVGKDANTFTILLKPEKLLLSRLPMLLLFKSQRIMCLKLGKLLQSAVL